MRITIACIVAFVLTLGIPAAFALTLDTGDGLSVDFANDGAVNAVTLDGVPVPLQSGQTGGLWLQVGTPIQPSSLYSLDFNSSTGSLYSAFNSNWENTGRYITWYSTGGINDTGHILLGNGTSTGVGMAMSAPIAVTPGSTVNISWQAKSASTETAQILCVRVYDTDGTDITSTTSAPSGWGWSPTSMAHYIAGLTCATADTWQSFLKSYVVSSNAAFLRVSLRHWTGGDHWVHVDDFRIDVLTGLYWAARVPVRGMITPIANGFTQSVDVPGHSIHVDATVTASAGKLEAAVALQDTTSPMTDRPLRLSWTLPVAVSGWTWWDDATDNRTIAAGTDYSNAYTLTNHAISRYPYAAVSSGNTSVMLAVPMDGMVVQRFSANAATGFSSTWEMCLSPLTWKIGAGRATASMLLARTDPAWGFRSATQRYHEFFPQFFEKRTTREGTWLWPLHPNQIPNPQDFGFAFHETHPITNEADRASCEQNDVGIYYYTEPWLLWMNWPDATTMPSYEDRVARLQFWADNPGAYASWQASGGTSDSPHLLLGDGATVGVGMATSDTLTPPAGASIRIVWQAKTANLATLQIVGVRVYDASGSDITSSTSASGWSYSSTSKAHIIAGIANTVADTWHSFAYTYPVPSAAASIRVSVRHWTGGDHFAHIDDLQVTSLNGATVYLSLDFINPTGGWVTAQNDNWNSPAEPVWYRIPRQQAAQKVIGSSPLDANGRFAIDLNPWLWNQGTTGGSQGWPINADPDLPEPSAYQWIHDSYMMLDLDRNDGVYIDSVVVSSGLGNWENHRSDHLAVTDTPLTYSVTNGGAVQLAAQAHNEFLDSLAPELHAMGKEIFCNIFPEAMRFHAHRTDVLGSEIMALTESNAYSRVRRTLAGKRIVTNLLQYNWYIPTYITYDEMEKYIRGQLFWGFYPGVSSGGGDWVNGAPDRYFNHPEFYERDRPLFQHYIPVIRSLSIAGWEPLTYAFTSPAGDIERFGDFSRGPVYVTVRGSAGAAYSGNVTVDVASCGAISPLLITSVTDALGGTAVDFDRLPESGRIRFTVNLAAEEVGVYRVDARPPVIADYDQDGDVDALDYDAFSACYNGPVNLVQGDCLRLDFNNDAHVDASDFDVFSACYNGPTGIPGC